MSTKLPRIAVTVNADTHATFAKLATLQRRPKSAIAADLLEEMTPALQRIVTLLEAATKQRSKLPADTAAKLNELEAMVSHMASFSLDRMASHLVPGGAPDGTADPKAASRRRRKH